MWLFSINGNYYAKNIPMTTNLKGLSRLDRKRLAAILRGTKGTVDVADVAGILDVSRPAAGKMLSRWAANGWFSRVARGVYIPVPLESKTSDIPLEDAWIVADRLFGPCYIGGWSAAEYWGLTEQIFRTIIVLTIKQPRNRRPNIQGTSFWTRSIAEKAMFGLAVVWRGQVKVKVSDPTRTILDLLVDPRLGGGIRSTVDIFRNYLQTADRNLTLLIDYSDQLGNGAVFKRLGFLLEQMLPDEAQLLRECRNRLTQGNARLDSKLPADRLITRWRLWVPDQWQAE